MSGRKTRTLAAGLALFASGALGGVAIGQSTSAAKDDGKSFGAAIVGKAQTATSQAPTPDKVPNFTTAPAQSALFENPDAIAAEAGRAASSNEGYATVRSSLDRRPHIPVADIEATIARGQAVSADPSAFVSGMSVGGTGGNCRELPPGGTGTTTYEATCNQGVALEQRTEQCAIPLVVSVTRTSAYRYWCSEFNAGFNRVDDCSKFEQASCTVTGSHEGRCLQGYSRPPYNYCTEPGEPVEELLCPTEVAGATLKGTETQTSTSERRDESACSSAAADTDCTLETETCTASDSVTRIVDGVSVTKPCWAWGRTYQCNRKVAAQNCDTLDKDEHCRFVREECLTDEDPCPTKERIYSCTVPAGASSEKQYVCDGDIYCINGDCETIDRQPNTEFRDAVVALNAAADAGRQFDPNTLTLFKGERETCHSKVFGLLNCCAGKAFPLIPYSSLLVALGCSREEVLLHQRDNQGLCTYVGSYCSDSVLGVCVTKKKVYCCFESKLSRILQEQGRAQLGKPWAKPKKESCQGFTVDEFSRLDLSKMDFSEVYAEFQDAAKLPEELSTVSTLQQKISGYYALSGAGK